MTDQPSPSARIDAHLAGLEDWRGAMLSHVRGLILDADRDIVEAVKWVKPSNPSGVPTWEQGGLICTGEVYKTTVKLTFAHGAALADPTGLFNAGTGGTRRAIDLKEGQPLNGAAFQDLVRAAVALNHARRAAKRT